MDSLNLASKGNPFAPPPAPPAPPAPLAVGGGGGVSGKTGRTGTKRTKSGAGKTKTKAEAEAEAEETPVAAAFVSPLPKPLATPLATALATTFGGRIVTTKRHKGCPHWTSREEPFVCLELPVKRAGGGSGGSGSHGGGGDGGGGNISSILDSLSSYVKGEAMVGANRVYCDECGVKVRLLIGCLGCLGCSGLISYIF